MIFIYDNGMDYSDHSLEFLECAMPQSEDVAQLLNAYGQHVQNGGHGMVIAVAESIEWRDGGACDEVARFVQASCFFELVYDDYFAFSAKRTWGVEKYRQIPQMTAAVTDGLARYLIDCWSADGFYVWPVAEEALKFVRSHPDWRQ